MEVNARTWFTPKQQAERGSDGRAVNLALGIVFLTIADVVLAFGATIPLMMFGVVFWGLHMGFTQGLLATLVADTAPVSYEAQRSACSIW